MHLLATFGCLLWSQNSVFPWYILYVTKMELRTTKTLFAKKINSIIFRNLLSLNSQKQGRSTIVACILQHLNCVNLISFISELAAAFAIQIDHDTCSWEVILKNTFLVFPQQSSSSKWSESWVSNDLSLLIYRSKWCTNTCRANGLYKSSVSQRWSILL